MASTQDHLAWTQMHSSAEGHTSPRRTAPDTAQHTSTKEMLQRQRKRSEQRKRELSEACGRSMLKPKSWSMRHDAGLLTERTSQENICTRTASAHLSQLTVGPAFWESQGKRGVEACANSRCARKEIATAPRRARCGSEA